MGVTSAVLWLFKLQAHRRTMPQTNMIPHLVTL